jgi:O-antigen/teichoic acid export membrane protein
MGTGLLTFIGPLVTLPFSHRVAPMVAFLIAARLGALVLYLSMCLRVLPSIPPMKDVKWSTGLALFRLGGWMTVSNVISPLMTYLDRFIIAGVLSLDAVAFYATPFEIATKLLLIPGALAGVLFPAFSGLLKTDRGAAGVLYRKGIAATALLLLPPTVMIVFFARKILTMWLGAAFATHSQHVLQILALGVLVNGVAAVPFSFIQAAGKPQVTAVLHLLELPAYAAACWYLTRRFGLDGAAAAWTGRVMIDGALLLILARGWSRSRVRQSERRLGSLAASKTLTGART